MQFKKEAVVSARLHESTKQKLYKTGYNPADAIEWFVHEWYNNNPKKRIAIKKDLLELQIENWKKVECEAQLEIETLEKKLEELIRDNDSDFDSEVEEEVSVMLPLNLQKAVDRIKPVFEDKREFIVGKNTSPEDALDIFITSNGDFVRNVYSEFCKGLDWADFKDLLLSEVVT